MSLFLIPPYVLVLKRHDVPAAFPVRARVELTLAPEDAFGVPGATVRTVLPRAQGGQLRWNANEGTYEFEAGLIRRIAAISEADGLHCEFDGNSLVVTFEATSLEHCSRVVGTLITWGLPLLGLWLGTYVWSKQCLLSVGETSYRAELGEIRPGATIAEAEDTERKLRQIAQTIARLRSRPGRARLRSALLYLQQARRLERQQPLEPSMVSEVLLNVAKSLEVLFGDRDGVRAGLRAAGIGDRRIERRITPILLLRSKLDVAHASLAALTHEERQVVRDFAANACFNVATALSQIVEAVGTGSLVLDEVSTELDKEKRQLIEAIRQYVAEPD